jgi:endonuclease/exonuclease/phosphatase family metal-dependent hydrolase
MRIASYNVENLFERALALNLPTTEEGSKTLERYAAINELLNQTTYTPTDRAQIVELLINLGLGESDDGSAAAFVRLRQNRGNLLERPSSGGIKIVANGRGDWIGWVELKSGAVDELATRHTAMVIRDIHSDILGVVEVESRIALQRFAGSVLKEVGASPFAHFMAIDGNDDRGIDVGIATKRGFEILAIRSHVDDADGQGRIFSRDCPEYTIATPSGQRLIVLVNHFKSKGFGSPAESSAKRRRQARRVVQIYKRLLADGETNVVVLGDLNDAPDSNPLAALRTDTDLRDISQLPAFTSDGRPGTYENGTKSDKIDYILLSPALQQRVTGGAIFRKGVWGGKNGTLFPHYPTITQPVQAASDHAAIFADIDL